jgi:hypothetical protein
MATVARPRLTVAEQKQELPRALGRVIDSNNEIERRLQAAEADVDTLQIDLDTAESAIDTAEADITALENTVHRFTAFVSRAAGTGGVGTGAGPLAGDIVVAVIDMVAGSNVTVYFDSPLTVDSQITENTFIGASRACLLVYRRPS